MFRDGEGFGDARDLEHGAAPEADLGGVRGAAEDPGGSGLQAQRPEQQADRGGLAGPVRPEHREHLPLADREIEPVEREDVSVAMADAGEAREGGIGSGGKCQSGRDRDTTGVCP